MDADEQYALIRAESETYLARTARQQQWDGGTQCKLCTQNLSKLTVFNLTKRAKHFSQPPDHILLNNNKRFLLQDNILVKV